MRIQVTTLILLLLVPVGCQPRFSSSETDGRDPFTWSMCGYSGSSIVLSLPLDGKFELVAVDLETGELTRITETVNLDERSANFNQSSELLTFVRSHDGSAGDELVTLDVTGKAKTIVAASKDFRIDSVSSFGPAEWYFTGCHGIGLATDQEKVSGTEK